MHKLSYTHSVCHSCLLLVSYIAVVFSSEELYSPDEASPGGLARPLESIGRGSSKERLIIVVHPL